MFPYQTLKNEIRKILVDYKKETGMKFKFGQQSVNLVNQYLDTTMKEIVEQALKYAEYRGRKAVRVADIELAWQVLHGNR